jgi:hypothetical protein
VGSAGVSGLVFLAAREDLFLFRCGRFFGVDSFDWVVVLV